jgi:hypothetical protein
MITTQLYDGQGLGNQLWAYAVTRLIANGRGMDFCIADSGTFKGRGFINLNFGTDLPQIDQTYFEPEGKDNGRSMWPYDPNLFDVPPFTKIEGNFQSYQYIRGEEDLVREWIKPEIRVKLEDAENTCVIHCRMGDFVLTDVFLPYKYYLDAMREVRNLNPNVKFVVVSDQPDKAAHFLGVEPHISFTEDEYKASHHFGGDVSVDFGYLYQAHYLIIPNSSFSWWAAFLNPVKKIVVAPKFWAGYNHGFWQTKDIETDGFTYV